LAISLTACGQPDIIVSAPPPPAEWLDCADEPQRPSLDPLTAYPAEDNGLIYRKGDVDARDSVIARYLVALRAAHFSCANNLAKVKQYHTEAE
jgi:hypothetical protein